jgi:hypothetical protein
MYFESSTYCCYSWDSFEADAKTELLMLLIYEDVLSRETCKEVSQARYSRGGSKAKVCAHFWPHSNPQKISGV